MDKDILKEFIDKLLSFEYKSRVDKKHVEKCVKELEKELAKWKVN